ncbi:hypothetical protein FOI42_RS04230 [Escherichia coli]|nr:hypothetical protein [Escherichia coli]MED6699523.1 hypothetical protein [Escherichia coli O157]USL83640.1 hypothetical protein A4_564 [Escherichia phage A4]HCQ0858471.1 hypothetical protein [Escherichia coli]
MAKVTREDIILKITEERQKQIDNPNTLSDTLKTKNDWASLCAYYLFEGATRPDKHVSFDEFRESLIKAGAVILAALETSFALEDEKLQELMSALEHKNDDK